MRLLRTPDVLAVTGLSRMTIYRLEKAGEFPARRRLSPNSVAWLEEEILNWLVSRPACQRTVPALRTLTALPELSSEPHLPTHRKTTAKAVQRPVA